jgi:hypothetical protein
MDKKIADSYQQLDDHYLAMDKTLNARIEESHATLTATMEDSQRCKQSSPQQWRNSCRFSTILSATITTQGHVHQDLLPAPTMGVTMSAINNLTLKSIMQTNNHILIAYVRGRNLPHARMRDTYTLRARVIHHMS